MEYRILEKKNCITSEKFGCKPEDRPFSELLDYGIVNIDKPRGPTSHQVSDYVKRIMGVSKAGHSGTLDPKVTGCLPVAIGRGTRIVQSLLTAGKEYVAIMHLHSVVPEEKIREACSSFIGKIRQLPPVKSSVKRQLRWRKVYYLEILEIEGQDVLFKVGTQAGTYIRKLIHDIGQKLGTGAHMAELRRTKAGPFDESSLATLQELTDALSYYKEGNDKLLRKILLPIEEGVRHLPKVWVMDTAVDSICHGASVKLPGVCRLNSDIDVDNTVAILTLKDELIATGQAKMTSKQMTDADKGIAVKTQKVFMLPGLYPKVEVKR